MTRSLSIDDIEALFMRHGNKTYEDANGEPVTTLEHSLQCAQLAEWAHADETLVAAAFLHDLRQFISTEGEGADASDEALTLPQLVHSFGPAVTEPIRLHMAARRYLAAVDLDYRKSLSPTALQMQGGPMSADEAETFETTPYAMDAVQLRRWDELAKVPGHRTPPLDYYLALLEDLQRSMADRDKLEVGPQTVT